MEAKHTYTGEDLQMNIFEVNGKFHVVAKDIESGSNLPVGKIFPAHMEAEAINYAKTSIGESTNAITIKL